jgi:hypothetical protein
MKNRLLLGIDPDTEKSGVAFKNGNLIELSNLTFFQLFDFLSFYKEREEKPIIYIECGFLNKSNWHTNEKQSKALASKIGERTGANFEVSKKIVEMCEYLNLPYEKIKPTRSKVNSDFFKQITGISQRTNQENRDAYMLIHGR